MDLEPFVPALPGDMAGGKNRDRLKQGRGRPRVAFVFWERVGERVLEALPVPFGEPPALVDVVAPSPILLDF